MEYYDIDLDLVHVVRGQDIDCVHRGCVVMVKSPTTDMLYERGDSRQIVFMRSLAKPFQAMSVLQSGAAEKYAFTSAELALMCGSHSGNAEQTQVLEGIMRKIDATIGDLQCGVSTPIDRKTAEQLIVSGQKPTALHHPCSGKHLGMLAICKVKGWSIEGYTHEHHPVQQYIEADLRSTVSLAGITFALDGCSVPTYGMPLYNVALGFARLATYGEKIAQAMRENPVLMSGQRRMDTALMVATGGRVIAKDGTEGIFGLAVPEKGIGLALKISDGSNRAIMPTLTKVLRDHDLITAEEAEKLTAQFPLEIKIHTGEQAGELRVVI